MADFASYTIKVTTGESFDAGSSAGVYITLFSDKDATDELKLRDSRKTFQFGQVDKFDIKAKDIGAITHIQMRLDHTGFFPSWFLNTVSVRKGTEETLEFPYYGWLDKDKQLSVILYPDSDCYCNTMYEYTNGRKVPSPYLNELPFEQVPKLKWFSRLVYHLLFGDPVYNAKTTAPVEIGHDDAHKNAHQKPGEKIQLKPELKKSAKRDSQFYTLFKHLGGLSANVAIHAVRKISYAISSIFTIFKPARATRIQEFDKGLKDKPETVTSWKEFVDEMLPDATFCEYRLSGPNPTSIRRASNEDVSKLFSELDDAVKKTLEGKQIFVVDYSCFATFSPNKNFIKGVQKYVLGSVALFRQDGPHLVSVCIKVIGRQDYQSEIMYPNEGDDLKWKWAIAKCIFQSNDSDFHEALVHLGGAHLVSEIFMVATFRRFENSHPLHALLAPHFEGTAFINSAADTFLVDDNGVVDALVSQDIKEIRLLVSKHIEEITSVDMRFPERIKAREMDVSSAPDLDFPYRDDGMLLWNAIHKWVTAYIKVFYPADKYVADDRFIRKWIQDLRSPDGGNIKWLEKFQYTVAGLADVVTTAIFTASVEHAAVNFPQRTQMQFAPAFPLAIYNGEGVCFKQQPTEKDYFSLFPPLSVAKEQAKIGYLLGGIRYTQLGQYEKNQFGGLNEESVYIDKVNIALAEFKTDLDEITKKIHDINMKRAQPYYMLLPENIPQSVNI